MKAGNGGVRRSMTAIFAAVKGAPNLSWTGAGDYFTLFCPILPFF